MNENPVNGEHTEEELESAVYPEVQDAHAKFAAPVEYLPWEQVAHTPFDEYLPGPQGEQLA